MRKSVFVTNRNEFLLSNHGLKSGFLRPTMVRRKKIGLSFHFRFSVWLLGLLVKGSVNIFSNDSPSISPVLEWQEVIFYQRPNEGKKYWKSTEKGTKNIENLLKKGRKPLKSLTKSCMLSLSIIPWKLFTISENYRWFRWKVIWNYSYSPFVEQPPDKLCQFSDSNLTFKVNLK